MKPLLGDWMSLVHAAAVGIPVYIALILFLRLSNKRALAKINAYGLVVTVALGSILATTFISREARLADGLLAIALLLILQLAIAMLVRRFPRFEQLVTQRPTLMLYRGRPIEAALRSQRVTRREIAAAIRAQGHMDLGAIHAVVLEANGDFSVIVEEEDGDGALEDVVNYGEARSASR